LIEKFVSELSVFYDVYPRSELLDLNLKAFSSNGRGVEPFLPEYRVVVVISPLPKRLIVPILLSLPLLLRRSLGVKSRRDRGPTFYEMVTPSQIPSDPFHFFSASEE